MNENNDFKIRDRESIIFKKKHIIKKKINNKILVHD